MSLVPLPQVTDDAERRVGDSISPLSPSLPNQAELSASPIILSAALNKLADMARLALQHQQDTFQQFVNFVRNSEDRISKEHNQELERERSQAHELLQQRLLLVEAQHSQERLQQELRHTQETLERLRGQGQKETDLASSLLTNPQTKSSKLPLGQKKEGGQLYHLHQTIYNRRPKNQLYPLAGLSYLHCRRYCRLSHRRVESRYKAVQWPRQEPT